MCKDIDLILVSTGVHYAHYGLSNWTPFVCLNHFAVFVSWDSTIKVKVIKKEASVYASDRDAKRLSLEDKTRCTMDKAQCEHTFYKYRKKNLQFFHSQYWESWQLNKKGFWIYFSNLFLRIAFTLLESFKLLLLYTNEVWVSFRNHWAIYSWKIWSIIWDECPWSKL